MNVLFVVDELVSQEFLEMRADTLQAGHAIDHIASQMKTIDLIQHGHIERGCGGSFLLISADMHIVVVTAPVSKAVNQPGIAVVGKDDRFVSAEHRIEITV